VSATDRFPVRVGIYSANISLLDFPGAEASFLARLNAEERTRLNPMKSVSRRREFLVSRALVRAALAAWSGTEPSEWLLLSDARGRPFAQSSAHEVAVPSLSWSHTGNYVVCALCEGGEVGVDVEQVRSRDVDGMASEVLADEERCYLDRQPETLRLETFYRFWTLKEACSKALGTGMGTPLRSLVFSWEKNPERIHLMTNTHVAGPSKFLCFIPASQTVAALAVLCASAASRFSMRFFAMSATGEFDRQEVEIIAGTVA